MTGERFRVFGPAMRRPDGRVAGGSGGHEQVPDSLEGLERRAAESDGGSAL